MFIAENDGANLYGAETGIVTARGRHDRAAQPAWPVSEIEPAMLRGPRRRCGWPCVGMGTMGGCGVVVVDRGTSDAGDAACSEGQREGGTGRSTNPSSSLQHRASAGEGRGMQTGPNNALGRAIVPGVYPSQRTIARVVLWPLSSATGDVPQPTRAMSSDTLTPLRSCVSHLHLCLTRHDLLYDPP